MIKVLIVDDEPTMRKGLISKIDWTSLQLECSGEAGDGWEALELFESTRPEVLIVDIRMPEMDGLELIAQVIERHPTTRCIIVSGHSDFDYARRAMKYGVIDYLLKPVDDEALHNVLVNIRDQILQDKKENDYRQFLKRQYNLYQDENRDRELSRLVVGTRTEDGCGEILEFIPQEMRKSDRWVAVIIQMESFTLPHAGFRLDEEALIWFGLRNIVEEQIKEAGHTGMVFKHAYHLYDIVVLVGTRADEDNQRVQECLSEAISGLHKYFKLKCSVGIGEPVDEAASIYISYQQAVSAVKTKILKGFGNIYDYAEIRQNDTISNSFSITSKEVQLLYAYLDDKKESELVHWLTSRFQQMVASPSVGYPHMERLYVELDAVFRKYLIDQIGEPEVLLDDRNDLIPFLINLHSWRDALAEIQRKAVSIMKFDRNRGNVSGHDIVVEVKQYIDRCYNENLSLKWVAENFFIHPNYFSKLFKEQCGGNFNDYLTKVRLARAEELLRDSDFRISRIAELVGYKDSTYFSSVFKRVHGISPIQYREQYQNP